MLVHNASAALLIVVLVLHDVLLLLAVIACVCSACAGGYLFMWARSAYFHLLGAAILAISAFLISLFLAGLS